MPIIILVKSKSKAHLGFVCARNRRASKHMEERNHTFCRNYANACGLACFRQRRQSIKRTCKSYLSAIHVLARSTNSRTLSEWKKARDIKYSNRFYSRVIYAFIYFIVIMVIHQFFGWHENALNFFFISFTYDAFVWLSLCVRARVPREWGWTEQRMYTFGMRRVIAAAAMSEWRELSGAKIWKDFPTRQSFTVW